MMSADDVVEILALAESLGIEVRIDGGWGVDALLGRQTREHDDLDLFIEKRQAASFAKMLERAGFHEMRKSYTTSSHTVWRDARGRIVDLHLFEFDPTGSYVFEDAVYPPTTFGATGRIAGKAVRCIPAEEQVLFHLGYEHDENDLRDVTALCTQFGIDIPEEYKHQITES